MNKKLALIRAAIIVFNAACAAFAIYLIIKNPLENNIYGFFAHDKRYFHCPTCGATRAVYCILTGDFKSAFYYHAYLTTTLPVFIYIDVCLSVNGFFFKRIVPYPKKFAVYLYILLALLLAFTVIRNFTSVVY